MATETQTSDEAATYVSDNEAAAGMVAYGYSADTGCAFFRVGFPVSGNPECDASVWALAAISAIGRYNNFDGPAIAERLRGLIPALWSVEVGAEYSPVLYLEAAEEKYRGQIESVLRDLGADELDWVGDSRRGLLRAWWD